MAISVSAIVSRVWPIAKLDTSTSNIYLKIYSQKLFLLSAILIHIIISCVVISSCYWSFNCWTFLPTLSYIGFFRGYDRVLVMTFSAFTPILLLFFSAAFTNYDATLSKVDSIIMMLIGILISFAVPFTFIIDEVASSFYVYMEKVHLLIVIGMISLGIIWIFLSFGCMYKLQTYSFKQSRFWKKLLIYLFLNLCVLLISIYTWYYSSDTSLESIEAVFEYITVSMSVYLPYLYSKSFQVTKIRISVKTPSHSLLGTQV
ncbi:unnamed protein product [Blepharisma stoltei]|uniref:Uncharacterized protein n=1 Tax=Blepharisma stoltei TaxID=1481888 RepID=A0AAU9IR53_9CILI|nr:unnamed protein product [Blepharisma stoltei]